LSIDDDVHALIMSLQGRMRRGVPAVTVTGRLGRDATPAMHRLVAEGRLYWATDARRPGGDRYNLLKAATKPTVSVDPGPTPGLW
jgi:hypothetical protein